MNIIIDYGEMIIFAVLAFSSILALAVSIERSVVFYRNRTKYTTGFITDLTSKLHSHDIDGALKLSAESGPHVYQYFASYALSHYSAGHEGLNELMDGKKIEISADLEKHISVLNTLGNNAPFIGLLGTVLGVIKAFHGLGMLGGAGAEIVMKSISSALVATAAGLAVAIPVVIVNNHFSTRTKEVMQNLEILSKEFIASYSYKLKKHARNDNHF